MSIRLSEIPDNLAVNCIEHCCLTIIRKNTDANLARGNTTEVIQGKFYLSLATQLAPGDFVFFYEKDYTVPRCLVNVNNVEFFLKMLVRLLMIGISCWNVEVKSEYGERQSEQRNDNNLLDCSVHLTSR
ncbi:hypothetical protein NPIL_557251 [Nephila pilipes]|uniref:Uncharacterized protein n=1 Tax=Nephila pilipes TaxID=299642 RepID=A0A8X6U0L2_NEPPI|nr:hypothetical protein NPIL_557251 [Nephila pilipes]